MIESDSCLYISNIDSDFLTLLTYLDEFNQLVGEITCVSPEAIFSPLGNYHVLRETLRNKHLVIVRLLGGTGECLEGLKLLQSICREQATVLIALSGESLEDEELHSLSNIDRELLQGAFRYLSIGGAENFRRFLCYMAGKCLGKSYEVLEPLQVERFGFMGDLVIDKSCPTVAVIFYRALYLAGNTLAVETLLTSLRSRQCNAVGIFAYSLRGADGDGVRRLIEQIGANCIITTMWAAGGAKLGQDSPQSTMWTADGAVPGQDSLQWRADIFEELRVPVIQAIAVTNSQEEWRASKIGLSPIDVAMSVAIPEFDGRIISTTGSFKEVVDDGIRIGKSVTSYRTVDDRIERISGIAARFAKLSSKKNSEKKIAIILSAYPTKKSRVGNAVGLDTPASVLEFLKALVSQDYSLSELPDSPTMLMNALTNSSTNNYYSLDKYERWFLTLSDETKKLMIDSWGESPGKVGYDLNSKCFRFAGLHFGENIYVGIQPSRGYGENPIAIYHSPDLPPTHHYMAFYRWVEEVFQADAIVHMGKHGNLEWLPGKGVGLSNECFPDLAISDIPLFYPFIVNDPGEGAQAKRRSHAVIVDHLVPPMTRAGSYGDLSRLESLLDEHTKILTLDPAKLPAIRRELWECLVESSMHRELGLNEDNDWDNFGDEGFDDLIGEIDGYLCELKDAQIRGGLHVLGQAPRETLLVDLILEITRLPQGSIPSLRYVVARQHSIDPSSTSRSDIDHLEQLCRDRVEKLAACDFQIDSLWDAPDFQIDSLWDAPDSLSQLYKIECWICNTLVPALNKTSNEINSLVCGLDGKYISPGPSGAPTRGMAHVLPTGRNFYSLDPRAIPSVLSYEVGSKLAQSTVEKFLSEEGRYPKSVGLVVWGTATMRTAGDDISHALALMGVEPLWDEVNARVTGLKVIDREVLGRPRVGVTIRISGFFRDAFPNLIELFNRAVELVELLDEPDEFNPLACEFRNSIERVDPRVFGPKPGGYGVGILALLESGQWEGIDDLGEVFLKWSEYSYSDSLEGILSQASIRRRIAGIEIAVKNQDNREHDIFDSDDYMQEHGGLVAAIKHLSGSSPKAYFGDSSNPVSPKLKTLAQEAAKVMRSRVLNPKWIGAMQNHGYKGAFEMAATVDYVFGYDATTGVVDDWMYEGITQKYVGDSQVRDFFKEHNPHALESIALRLTEAQQRGLWDASPEAQEMLRGAILEYEGWTESQGE